MNAAGLSRACRSNTTLLRHGGPTAALVVRYARGKPGRGPFWLSALGRGRSGAAALGTRHATLGRPETAASTF